MAVATAATVEVANDGMAWQDIARHVMKIK
jgi:hypothetical protein